MNRINITIIFSLLARPHARNEGRYLWYIRMDEPSCSNSASGGTIQTGGGHAPLPPFGSHMPHRYLAQKSFFKESQSKL